MPQHLCSCFFFHRLFSATSSSGLIAAQCALITDRCLSQIAIYSSVCIFLFSLRLVFTLHTPLRQHPPPSPWGAALIGSELGLCQGAVCCCTAAMTTSTDDASAKKGRGCFCFPVFPEKIWLIHSVLRGCSQKGGVMTVRRFHAKLGEVKSPSVMDPFSKVHNAWTPSPAWQPWQSRTVPSVCITLYEVWKKTSLNSVQWITWMNARMSLTQRTANDSILWWTHPDLELDPLVVPVNRLHFEVDANSADEGVAEGIVCVPEQKAGFANAAVTNDEQLEHVVEVLVWAIFLAETVVSFSHLET